MHSTGEDGRRGVQGGASGAKRGQGPVGYPFHGRLPHSPPGLERALALINPHANWLSPMLAPTHLFYSTFNYFLSLSRRDRIVVGSITWLLEYWRIIFLCLIPSILGWFEFSLENLFHVQMKKIDNKNLKEIQILSFQTQTLHLFLYIETINYCDNFSYSYHYRINDLLFSLSKTSIIEQTASIKLIFTCLIFQKPSTWSSLLQLDLFPPSLDHPIETVAINQSNVTVYSKSKILTLALPQGSILGPYDR